MPHCFFQFCVLWCVPRSSVLILYFICKCYHLKVSKTETDLSSCPSFQVFNHQNTLPFLSSHFQRLVITIKTFAWVFLASSLPEFPVMLWFLICSVMSCFLALITYCSILAPNPLRLAFCLNYFPGVLIFHNFYLPIATIVFSLSLISIQDSPLPAVWTSESANGRASSSWPTQVHLTIITMNISK